MKIYSTLDNLIMDNTEKIFAYSNKILQKKDFSIHRIPKDSFTLKDDSGVFEVVGDIVIKRHTDVQDNRTRLVFSTDVDYTHKVKRRYTIVVIQYIDILRSSYTIKILDRDSEYAAYIINYDMYNFEKKIKIALQEPDFVNIVDILIKISGYISAQAENF